jgi:hypothetical protein
MLFMLKTLMTCLLALFPGEIPVAREPDGVHVSGTIQSFRAEPFPPDWVRLESHILADPDCHHYVYEAYGSDVYWLVRYVLLPEGQEEFRDIEQIFLLSKEHGRAKPVRFKPSDVQIGSTEARLKGQVFRLVDRRDLLRD